MIPVKRARPDVAQPKIVEDLRKAGFEVWIIGQPDDLLIRDAKWPMNWFRMLSVKTPDRKGRIKIRKVQEEQNKFCDKHGVPRVGTSEQAINAVQS